MAGLLDLHIVGVLQSAWEYYKTDAARFRELFPFGVEPDVLNEWHARLVQSVRTQSFHLVNMPGVEGGDKDKFPDVSVELREESPFGPQLLGDGREVDQTDGRTYVTMFLQQSVRIDLFAYTGQELRALQRIVYAALLSEVPNFIKAGYASLDYEGNSALEPHEALLAESLGAMVFRMNWSAKTNMRLPTPDATKTSKSYWLSTPDIELDGIKGAVLPFDAE